MQQNDKLYFANAGDSRAIVGRQLDPSQLGQQVLLSQLKSITKQVTTDHKPHVPEERQRIEQYGSCVIESADDCSRVAGMLAVSRAIGDAPFKGCGVIATPEVFCVQAVDVEYVVIACDGLWDVLNNEEVGFIIQCVLAEAAGTQVNTSDPKLKTIGAAVHLFLQSDTLADEFSNQAERELAKLSQYDCPQNDSADIRATYQKPEDRYAPANIARILAKTAVAMGSEDNVSVVVGVKQFVYQK